MNKSEYSLFDFLTACGGNWRNAIFITCKPCRYACKNGRRGCLLSADQTGRLWIVSVSRFEAALGRRIDPTECCGTISRSAFETAFNAYLIWELNDPARCPLLQLDQKNMFRP